MSTKPIKTVALVGASGNLGPHVLKALLDAGFTVTVVTRETSTYEAPSQDVKVIRLPDSYPLSDLVSAFKNQDAVVCTVVPFTTDDLRFRLVDAAVQAGVHRFIPAEFGIDMNASALKVLPEMKGRMDVVEHYKSKESATFSWTGVTTNLFYDFGLGKSSLFLVNVKEKKARLLDGGDVGFSVCTMPTIGLAVAKILLKPDETRNKTLMVQSFATTQKHVLKTVEKVTGEKFEVGQLSRNELLAESDQKGEKGDPSGRLDRICLLGMLENDYRGKAEFANEMLGLGESDIEEETRKALKG